MNARRMHRQSQTGDRAADAVPAHLVDLVDLSPRERLVLSVALHVASVVLGVAAYLDRHYPVQASLPLGNHRGQPTGRRPRAETGLFGERPSGGSDPDEGHRSRHGVIVNRRWGRGERAPDDDLSEAGSPERYERIA